MASIVNIIKISSGLDQRWKAEDMKKILWHVTPFTCLASPEWVPWAMVAWEAWSWKAAFHLDRGWANLSRLLQASPKFPKICPDTGIQPIFSQNTVVDKQSPPKYSTIIDFLFEYLEWCELVSWSSWPSFEKFHRAVLEKFSILGNCPWNFDQIPKKE